MGRRTRTRSREAHVTPASSLLLEAPCYAGFFEGVARPFNVRRLKAWSHSERMLRFVHMVARTIAIVFGVTTQDRSVSQYTVVCPGQTSLDKLNVTCLLCMSGMRIFLQAL